MSNRRLVASRCVLVAAMLAAPPALAAELSVSTQQRELRSTASGTTTGYTCLDSSGGPPLPGCPVDLGSTYDEDVRPAPDAAPFSETATTAGGSASQTSSLGAAAITSTGTAEAFGSAAESMPGAPYLVVIDILSGTAEDDFATTFTLDEPAAFELSASGEIQYPDPSFPLGWDVALAIDVSGPEGEIASLSALPDLGCTPDASFQCTVAPASLTVSGVLPPGSYTVEVALTAAAVGGWLPSTGPLNSGASGSYALELRLVPGSELPVLGPVATAGLASALLTCAFAALTRERHGFTRARGATPPR